MNETMRNKMVLIVLVVVLAGLGLYAYNTFLAPKGVAGDKAVSLQVVIGQEEIDKTFNFDTDSEFLYGLIKENEDELGASFKEYDFGPMLIELMDYKADESNNEYFHITVNGEDAQTGPKEIALSDGDEYKFELKKW